MKDKFALLVIDVQEGLFNKKSEIYDKDNLIKNINKLIKHTRKTGNQPIFIQHNNKGFLKKNSAGWKLHDGIDFRKDDLRIDKEHGDAFAGTPLKDELEKLAVKKVIICGLVSHGCVRATCSGAVKNGFHAVLASDGHSNFSRHSEKVIQEVNEEMRRIADVKKTEKIMAD